VRLLVLLFTVAVQERAKVRMRNIRWTLVLGEVSESVKSLVSVPEIL
jgi:hypothetical protein